MGAGAAKFGLLFARALGARLAGLKARGHPVGAVRALVVLTDFSKAVVDGWAAMADFKVSPAGGEKRTFMGKNRSPPPSTPSPPSRSSTPAWSTSQSWTPSRRGRPRCCA